MLKKKTKVEKEKSVEEKQGFTEEELLQAYTITHPAHMNVEMLRALKSIAENLEKANELAEKRNDLFEEANSEEE